MLAAAAILILMLGGCGMRDAKEKADSISVYFWSASLYNTYAPYIQSKLPDVDIEFVVGNNDLDFYKFMKENGALPDIITSRRFSLHDAAELQDGLMALSYTEEASKVFSSYLENFTDENGVAYWLPLCGEADGFVANKALFDKYGIPLPTDCDSFAAACAAFEAVGIRGFATDFAYDYTCMELLQGLSIPELNSLDGQMWRHAYEDPKDETVGLDSKVWPGVFERMERFIRDAHIRPEDVELSYDPVIEMFDSGEVAMIRGTGSQVVNYQNQNVDAVFLPYFGQNGEQWLLTYPAFQVALNKNLEQDEERREQALQVLRVMLSEEGQNTLAQGMDVLSYSRNVELELSPALENLKPCIEQNHLYIRMASNAFFSVSKDVVQKMIAGEYDAKQAYEAFDAQLRQDKTDTAEIVLTLEKGYSNEFHKQSGNASASAMANTLRAYYGSDVLIAPANSFTGSVLKADYTEKQVGCMIMPNSLEAWQCELTGAELEDCLKAFIEGTASGFAPFNRGSLPTVSGISVEVKEEDGRYSLVRVKKDGKTLKDEDVFAVTCLNTVSAMTPYLENGAPAFEKGDVRVKNAWTAYIKEGGSLLDPESYITLK